MKKLLLLPILLFILVSFQGNFYTSKVSKDAARVMGSISEQDSVLCWVFFKDKGPESERYFSNPLLVVTEKSLERRAKYYGDAPLVDESDLPVYHGYIDALAKMGLFVRGKSKWLNGVSVYVSKKELPLLENQAFVNSIDLVARYSKKFQSQDKNYFYDDSRGNKKDKRELFELDYGNSFTQNSQINVTALHNLGITGSGVVICVLDAGFNLLEHEVFNQMIILNKWDFVNGDGGVGDSLDMGSGDHGTKVLSAIGGYKPGKLIGPAYGASYLLAKTENTDSETPVEEDNWIAAIEWADSLGADVATSSLGYLEYDDPSQSYTWEDMDGNTARITRAADLAVGKGIAVFVSAGNEGLELTHNTLGAPADGDSVISVGAVDADGERAYFSSVGPTADGRIKPDIMAMGQSTRVASSVNPIGYTTSSGTSFSCPIAAGAGALILSQRKNISPVELANALRSTADNSVIPNREYGWGILNAFDALQSIPATDIDEASSAPAGFTLFNNYPNPFNPSTRIDFEISENSEIQADLYNSAGEKVIQVVKANYSVGKHSIQLDASEFNSGVYFLKISSSKGTKVLKLVLAK